MHRVNTFYYTTDRYYCGIVFSMNEDLVFRTSKKAFWIANLLSICLIFIIIGIPMLIANILRYKNNSITITKNGLTYKSGIISKRENTVPFSKINSIDIKTVEPYSFWKYGSIHISTGNDKSAIKFSGIEDPRQFKAVVDRLISN